MNKIQTRSSQVVKKELGLEILMRKVKAQIRLKLMPQFHQYKWQRMMMKMMMNLTLKLSQRNKNLKKSQKQKKSMKQRFKN